MGHPTKTYDLIVNNTTSTLYHTTTILSNRGFFARIFLSMSRNGIADIDTPRKSRIKGICEWNDFHNILYFHTDVFRFHNVSKEAGWAILREDNHLFNRRHHNNEAVEERRGRKRKLSARELYQVDRFLQDYSWEARVLT